MNDFKYMSTRKIFSILILIVVILTGVRSAWTLYHKDPGGPQAEMGILDLRDEVFNDKHTFALDGEWEFYPNQLLTPGLSHNQGTPYIEVPGDWNAQSTNTSKIDYGTYRLKVLMPHDKQRLGLHVKDIATSADIYIDQKLNMRIGEPNENSEQTTSLLGTYKTFFEMDEPETEIMIHVANFDEAFESGITESILMGSEKAINKEVDTTKTFQLVVAIIIILHSMYAFGLYMVVGRKHKELIYFAASFTFIALSILIDEDKLLLSVFPMQATLSIKLLYVSFAGTLFFILKFIQQIFSLNSRIFRILYYLYIAMILLLFVLPFHLALYIGFAIMILNAFSYVFIFIQILRVIKGGYTDAIYILIANTINLLNVLWGIAINANLTGIPYYPVDYLVAIFVFTGFLFQRHLRIVRLNEEQKKELQQTDRMKDDFLANTSHELRNPLHAIINMAHTVLTENKQLPNKHKDNLKLLIRVGQQMTFTLNDLLDVTRLKDQKLQIYPKRVNLHVVANSILDMVEFLTGHKNIQLRLNVPADFPDLYVDENRLRQILFNLTHNAVKFTSEGSITIDATYTNNTATITVADTGIGIDESIQPIIFEPYTQKDATITAIGAGVGIGLNICKQLVELHGGKIEVHSIPHEGSVFSFTLPLANKVTDKSVSEQEIAATIGGETVSLQEDDSDLSADDDNSKKHTRILIVDDDPVNLKVLKSILASDYNISTASSGLEALALIDTDKWDLVISDVMMPNMSGYELTKKIREQFTIYELPIILLTARHQSKDIYAGFLAGANDYVSKPMDKLELQARVKALTHLKQSIDKQLQMEAAWLQAQIQPHFLFNTLNTIASLAEVDSTRMADLLTEFGNYLQRSFSVEQTALEVPIHDELELVNSYLFIQKQRFGNRLHIKKHIDDQLNFNVPPLSIQTLVENAIKHGALKRIENGMVFIRIREHNTYYSIEIVDNGKGMNENQMAELFKKKRYQTSGIGIANTERRLKQLYGEGLSITSEPGEGTTITFQIPKK